ncbi:hypothetical protein IFO70_26030 [Phormidium tenue FACHB-886]|nr:hypothetical protein [Phormidium tenue FACHB-886]
MDESLVGPSQLFPTGNALESVCQWSNILKSSQQCLIPYFARCEVRQAAFNYIQALLSPVERKNGWQMAERVQVQYYGITGHLENCQVGVF